MYAQLSKTCSSQSQNPERWNVPSEIEDLNELLCRQIITKNYRIFYQIIGKVVTIHGIIDGRRNIREVMRQRLLI